MTTITIQQYSKKSIKIFHKGEEIPINLKHKKFIGISTVTYKKVNWSYAMVDIW